MSSKLETIHKNEENKTDTHTHTCLHIIEVKVKKMNQIIVGKPNNVRI